MTEPMNQDPYSPIACARYSEYEIAILHRQKLHLRWHEGNARGPGWFSHQLADGSYCKGK